MLHAVGPATIPVVEARSTGGTVQRHHFGRYDPYGAGVRNKLFVQPGCAHCAEARAFLQEHGSVFVEYDVAADKRALELLLTLIGRADVPTLMAGYQAAVGFNREKWTEVLQHGLAIDAHDPFRVPESLGRDPYDDD